MRQRITTLFFSRLPDMAQRLPSASFRAALDATLDRHVTVWPGSYLTPGQSFQKTWRVLNSGDCAWPPGTVLVFVDGDQLTAPDQVEVEPLAPGETLDISVNMRAPSANGSYAATWQLQTANGEAFGEEMPISINVGPTPTPRSSATPLPTNTPLATATPAEPLNMSVPIVWGPCWRDPNAGTWGGTLVWSAFGGTGVYEFYYPEIIPANLLPGPSYNFSGQVDKPWSGRFWTVSGGAQVFADAYVRPEDCGFND